jgi:hypothetical protein
MSDKACSGAWSLGCSWRELVRGEDVGLSAARYVVAKMLSLSESCGRSMDDFHKVLSCTIGAVLERPVCARVFGVTAPWSDSGWQGPWPGSGGVLDLTDAGSEVFPGASNCCDMGPTLVKPSRRRACESVAGCLADIAGTPGTEARMRSLGAAEAQRTASWGGLAGEDRRRWLRDSAHCVVLCCAGWCCGQRVRIAAGPRSRGVWTGAQTQGAQRSWDKRKNDVLFCAETKRRDCTLLRPRALS